MCTYSRVSNVYTHSLPSAPPSSSQPGIFHSATPKCVLFYILCKFCAGAPFCPSFLSPFRSSGQGLVDPLNKFDTFFMTTRWLMPKNAAVLLIEPRECEFEFG